MLYLILLVAAPTSETFELIDAGEYDLQVTREAPDRLEIVLVIKCARASLMRPDAINVGVPKLDANPIGYRR